MKVASEHQLNAYIGQGLLRKDPEYRLKRLFRSFRSLVQQSDGAQSAFIGRRQLPLSKAHSINQDLRHLACKQKSIVGRTPTEGSNG